MISRKELRLLKERVAECLCSDDSADVCFFLDELIRYEKGFNILMDYFNGLDFEEKVELNKRLKRIGL